MEPDDHGGPTAEASALRGAPWRSEDWWSVWLGLGLVVAALVKLIPAVPKVQTWRGHVAEAMPGAVPLHVAALLLGLGALTAIGIRVMGRPAGRFLCGFAGVFILAVVAQVIGAQAKLQAMGLESALWAIVLGLLIANTLGTPAWLRAGVQSELYIKIGLVLLGAEILAREILQLGARGLLVAWMVTPVVILFMWFFGTRLLRITSRTLVIVIACATSVCGVSAAIASAAACRAKKEELTLAVGMTMLFTVAMMIGMPALCRAVGMNEFVAGAWIGGTVDSTGAVAAAGEMVSAEAGRVAALIKMIQNVLIGLIAFAIAVYWTTSIERGATGDRPGLVEIWHRFPKFVIGFLAMSLLFSFVFAPLLDADRFSALSGTVRGLRSWWFALAFVAIGLESDFRRLAAQLAGGRPLVLYLVGQSFNVVLTLLAAWIAFGLLAYEPAG